MYNKEKQQTCYIKNRESIKEKALQYYYDHKEEKQKYNNAYWALHGDKYKEKRKIDRHYKNYQSIYCKDYYLVNKESIIETSINYYYQKQKEKLNYQHKLLSKRNKTIIEENKRKTNDNLTVYFTWH